MIKSILRSFKVKSLSNFNNKNIPCNLERGIVSFTFDDFPQSASQLGAKMLEENGMRGTFYTALKLMDEVSDIGKKQFSRNDILSLYENGHEIGCHTYSHLPYHQVSFEKYIQDIGTNSLEFGKQFPFIQLKNFSFPFGRTGFRIKKHLGSNFDSCRGIFPGINYGTIDLNLLKANSLYTQTIPLEIIIQLIKRNQYEKGWLILYTHDIDSNPSPYGATPKYFQKIIQEINNSDLEVLTIANAIQKIKTS